MEIAKNKTMSFYIQIIAVVVLMVGIGKLPPIGSITPYGMQILGLFIGCIIGWSFGHQISTSLIALVLLSFTGENTLTGVFGNAYSNQSLLMLLFGLIFCFGVEQTGVMNYIANWILSRKFASRGPWMVSLAFWIASAICAALITNSLPVVILMWTMFYSVANKLGVNRTDKWVQITLIMICVTGYTGSVIMPYAGWNIMCYGIARSVVPELEMNFFAHTVLMVVMNIVILAVLYLLCSLVLARNVKCNSIENIVDIADLVMTKQQKLGILYLVVMVLMMFLPNIVPVTVPGIAILKNLGALGSFIVLVILMCVTYVDGKPLMNPVEAMKSIPWQLYFLLSAALLLASLISSADTGISATVVTALNAMIGSLGLFGVMAIFVGFGCFVTNAINNVVCVNIFVPIAAAMVVGMGGDANVITALLLMVLYLGLVLPSGSVIGAMMHGNSEWIQTSSIYKYASIGCAVVVLVCLFVGIPLGNMLF